jgi:NTP pyrophosphatase (non-canonical NTP hydrolase)
MTFDEYSEQSVPAALYPLLGRNMVYPALKLAGEAGEVADKIGKHWRNEYAPQAACGALESRQAEDEAACAAMGGMSLPSTLRTEIIKELGDVLWYVNALAVELGTTLDDVAEQNIRKVYDRVARGMVLGMGDNR